jgi:predicted PurR-regulated permease PerM
MDEPRTHVPGRPPVYRRPRRIDITAATFLRALAAVLAVWLWLRLWQWALVFVLGAFLAIALEPLIKRLDQRGIRRHYSAPLTMLLIVLVLFAFVYLAGTSLADQADLLRQRADEFRQQLMARIPPDFEEMLGGSSSGATGRAANLAGAAIAGVTGLGVALVVAVYLLIDGRRTYEWLAAYAPPNARGRVHRTAIGVRDVIAAYIRGNLITSALAAVFTWIALTALQVPAALLLAILAGVLDFVPVIGFFVSAAPAVLLGLTVSGTTGIAVAVFYVLYNLVENYYIQPKVYGREMRLSDLAVILAFLVGAQLGGVLGALVALPLAASYPVIERLWMDRAGLREVAEEHRRVESEPEH